VVPIEGLPEAGAGPLTVDGDWVAW